MNLKFIIHAVKLLVVSFFISIPTSLFAQTPGSPKLLVIDYAMGYPEENAGVMSIFTEAGFQVDYRQYYPALVQKDASDYDAIVLMGGGDPGMSLQEIDFAINFVSRGKLLILGVPSDTEYGGNRRVNAGAHDRFMFNQLLNRMNIRLYAFSPSVDNGKIVMPVTAFEPTTGHPVNRDITDALRLRAGTRILVGEGAEPLLVAPEYTDNAEVAAGQEEPSKPTVRMERKRIRVQPTESLPDEEIEVTLRGTNVLRVQLHYRSNRPPVPADWNTSEVKGRVTAVSGDSVIVRVPGNRWGSEYAIVKIPASLTAVSFVRRDMPVAIEASDQPEEVIAEMMKNERLAVIAMGQGDRLQKGLVLVADRGVLNALSEPLAPISNVAAELPDPLRNARYLNQVSRYVYTLVSRPDSWYPTNPYPTARMPGIQSPKFPVNQIRILPSLPTRVDVMTNETRPVDLVNTASVGGSGGSLRGVWEYFSRSDARTDSLLSLAKSIPLDFLWTVAPALSYTADSTSMAVSSLFETWGKDVNRQLSDSSLQWFVGVRSPSELEGDYRWATDARGYKVSMPSLFEMKYWERYVFEPNREIARFSRTSRALSGIIHDLETHISQQVWAYAKTDVFDDEPYTQFIRYLAHHGFYSGAEFNTFKNLEKTKRFEWLLKSGRLGDYFSFLESRAERLGQLYRKSVADINSDLKQGGFMRTPRLSWFHLGFWRGMTDPQRPYYLLTYEQIPTWYVQFLQKQGIIIRTIPMGLLGFINSSSYGDILNEASERGGYCLERGLWLVSDPEEDLILGAPHRQGMSRIQAVEAIRDHK